MKKIIGRIFVALCCVAIGLETMGQEKQVIKFDVRETEVAQFIKIFPELKNTLETSSGDESAMLMAMQNLPVVKLEALAKKYNFKDTADLMRVCGGTITAYAMLKMKEAEAQLNQELSTLPADMKVLMKSQIDAIKLQMKKFENQISDGTVSAVKNHYDKLNQLFEVDEE